MTIRILSQEVINKIAAGEIVQRPFSVVKEVLENSLDAKATAITIYFNGGGLDLIKIIDDGCGINKDDYPLICERYATSKISSVDDLSHLTSFGFRGEALASISFVSDLLVTSKQKDSEIGYMARFRNGKLFSQDNKELVQSIGCNDGTIIQVEGLFYNLTNRKTQINKLDEKKQVIKLVQSMAIHHQNVLFKLYLDKNCEFNNSTYPSRQEIMAQILKVPSESFLQLSFIDETYHLTCNLVFSRVSVVKAKKDLTLFVNNRLVDCESIKKAIENAYQNYYASVYDHLGGFFLYCSLNLKSDHVDHNVHPNKKEIRFINEVEISNDLCSRLKKYIQDESNSKKYSLKQSQLPNSQIFEEELSQVNKSTQQRSTIRADPKLRTLDNFVQKFKIGNQSQENKEQSQQINYNNQEQTKSDIEIEKTHKNQQIIQECLNILTDKIHPLSQDTIRSLVYVGSFTAGSIFVQLKTKLLLLSSVPILFCYFLNKLIQSFSCISNDEQTYQISFENYQEIIEYKDILSLMKIYIGTSDQKIQFYSFIGEKLKEQDIIIIQKQIQTNRLLLKTSSDGQKIFILAKIIAEALAFTYREQWVSEYEVFQQVGDKQLQSIYSQNEREKVDFLFKNEILPFLKSKGSIINLQFDNYAKEILKLENIYSVFERC